MPKTKDTPPPPAEDKATEPTVNPATDPNKTAEERLAALEQQRREQEPA